VGVDPDITGDRKAIVNQRGDRIWEKGGWENFGFDTF
jgi:hypothetical protein